MPLQVAVGHSSLTGPRERNEDFCGVVTPTEGDLENKGVLAAVADGIGGHRGGREAAELVDFGRCVGRGARSFEWHTRASEAQQGIGREVTGPKRPQIGRIIGRQLGGALCPVQKRG